MNNKSRVLNHYPEASLTKVPVVDEFRLQLWPESGSPVFMAEEEEAVWYDAVMYIGPTGDECNENKDPGWGGI